MTVLVYLYEDFLKPPEVTLSPPLLRQRRIVCELSEGGLCDPGVSAGWRHALLLSDIARRAVVIAAEAIGFQHTRLRRTDHIEHLQMVMRDADLLTKKGRFPRENRPFLHSAPSLSFRKRTRAADQVPPPLHGHRRQRGNNAGFDAERRHLCKWELQA